MSSRCSRRLRSNSIVRRQQMMILSAPTLFSPRHRCPVHSWNWRAMKSAAAGLVTSVQQRSAEPSATNLSALSTRRFGFSSPASSRPLFVAQCLSHVGAALAAEREEHQCSVSRESVVYVCTKILLTNMPTVALSIQPSIEAFASSPQISTPSNLPCRRSYH